MQRALLIPIFEPSDLVLPFLSSFSKEDFEAMIVVDDGSGEAFSSIFQEIERSTPFSVISYPKNHGKGYALRTGMEKILADHPDTEFIVTADGDGQHAREDILHMRDSASKHPEALVMGVRDFSAMPAKSQSGNKWASRYFYISTHKKLADTQTGLRAIPSLLLPLALATNGNRYEYEMNFLLSAGRQVDIVQVPIQTIYINNNEGSHFRPVRDSIRIAKTPIIYLAAGLASYGVDVFAYAMFIQFVFTDAATSTLSNFYAQLIARVISAIFNFCVLEFVVFHHKKNMGKSIWKYILLAIPSLAVGFGLDELFKVVWPHLIALKVIIDGILGIIKYFINRFLIFINRVKKNPKKS